MRTSIRLDDELLAEARELAARTGRTLSEVIEGALREALARHSDTEGKMRRVGPASFAGKGLLPGVDLDNTASLIDVMDEAR
jgi:metal-responsive CopG/Arc/MetJ family transcriptional regulator